MTADQHTDHISNGQRVSRHSLPTLLYFLFSTPHIFFNSNKRSYSRAPLKDKLNKRVILASRTLAHLQAAQADPQTQACKRAVSANAPTEHSDNKTDFLRILTNSKF